MQRRTDIDLARDGASYVGATWADAAFLRTLFGIDTVDPDGLDALRLKRPWVEFHVQSGATVVLG